MKTGHDVTASRDPDGRPVIGVQLTNRESRAWLYAADYHRVLEANGNGPWFANRNADGREYVRAHDPKADRLVMVSRLIMDTPTGSRVRFRDGCTTNLRRTNLDVSSPCRHPITKVSRRAH